jgi:hypothetical protein
MAGNLGPIRQYQLTLNASAQRLSTVIAAGGGAGDAIDGNPLCEWIDLQADDGNSNPIFVGADSGVSAANHGVRIPTPASGVPSPPYRTEGPKRLGDVWVIGTNNEKLNVILSMR